MFIVNTFSGSGRGSKVWSKVEKMLRKRKITYGVHFTKHPGHATQLAREALGVSSVNAVVAIGGDGTVHEVGNGLVGTPMPLGYIPAGSGNDLARAWNIPLDPEKALDRILKHDVSRVDTADLGDRKMIGFIGMGFDAQVAETVNQSSWKRWLGRGSYALGVIDTLRSFKPTRASFSIDGKRYEYDNVWLIAVVNIRNYGGGMKVCPQASYDDGVLDICCIRDISLLTFLRMFPSVYSGQHIHHPAVSFYQGEEIEIDAQIPLPIHADGEMIGRTPLSVKVQPQSLHIL